MRTFVKTAPTSKNTAKSAILVATGACINLPVQTEYHCVEAHPFEPVDIAIQNQGVQLVTNPVDTLQSCGSRLMTTLAQAVNILTNELNNLSGAFIRIAKINTCVQPETHNIFVQNNLQEGIQFADDAVQGAREVVLLPMDNKPTIFLIEPTVNIEAIIQPTAEPTVDEIDANHEVAFSFAEKMMLNDVLCMGDEELATIINNSIAKLGVKNLEASSSFGGQERVTEGISEGIANQILLNLKIQAKKGLKLLFKKALKKGVDEFLPGIPEELKESFVKSIFKSMIRCPWFKNFSQETDEDEDSSVTP